MSEQNIAKRSEFNYIFSYITKKLYSPWIMRQFVLVPSDQVINV